MEIAKLVGRELLEVFYAPVKAFRKIIEKPDFKGVLLVLVLVIAATVALQFVYNSKQIFEVRSPQDDAWTESLLANEYLWASSGSVILDTADYHVGNSSISSSVQDATSIWLKVTDFESIEVSEKTGYNELFFWVNWANDDGVSAASGTVKLFSGSEDSYFEKDVASLLASSGDWQNVILSVGPDQGWASVNSPDWETITGVELELVWSASANLNLDVDGLYFRNFVSPIESLGLTDSLLYITLSVSFSVGINWVLWAGIMLIVANLFGENVGQWNKFFVIIGHAFIITAVYTIVSALLFTSLPVLTMPIESELQVEAFSEVWLPNIMYQIGTVILWAGEVWLAALSAIVIRLMKDVPWGKAATIAAIAFGIRFVLRFFFGM
jgi:hypothetical protein